MLLFLIGARDRQLWKAVGAKAGALHAFDRLDNHPALGDEPVGALDLLVDRLLVVLVGEIGAVELLGLDAVDLDFERVHAANPFNLSSSSARKARTPFSIASTSTESRSTRLTKNCSLSSRKRGS